MIVHDQHGRAGDLASPEAVDRVRGGGQIGSLDSGPPQLRLAGACFGRLRGPDLKQNEAEGTRVTARVRTCPPEVKNSSGAGAFRRESEREEPAPECAGAA